MRSIYETSFTRLQCAISDRTSRLLPDLQQETKLAILAGLNILASGNANTAKAIVEKTFSYACREAKMGRGGEGMRRALIKHNRIGANYFVS